jgi:hypothetical protein
MQASGRRPVGHKLHDAFRGGVERALRRRQRGLGDLSYQSLVVLAGEEVRELTVWVDVNEHDSLAGLGELNGEGERVT